MEKVRQGGGACGIKIRKKFKESHFRCIPPVIINSLWDLFADLQKRGVFRDFDHETVFLDAWDPLSPHLKFHDEFDFDTFEL